MSQRQIFRSQRVMTEDGEKPASVIVEQGKILDIAPFDFQDAQTSVTHTFDGVLLPGLVDTHVHINEPGRTDWEGFDTATHAAAAGGITTLVDMPLNCIPVTTSAKALQAKLDSLGDKLWVDCSYWGGATADNLKDLPELLQAGVLGVKSFTIHSGIDEFQAVDEPQLLAAMRLVAKAGLPHLIHAELDHLKTPVDPIGDSYQRFLQSRPPVWENDAITMVIRVMRTLKQEGLHPHAHIVHLSSAEALPMIKQARDEGLHLTVETCPHYLTLSAENIPDGGTLYKCCPPVREKSNQDLLWQGLQEGVIDCIVSDHSPCTPQLKALDTGDIGDAWGGISALQFGLALIWTHAEAHHLSLQDISQWMSIKPAAAAGLSEIKGAIAPGFDADFCVFDPEQSYKVTAECIKHKHKISPYIGQTLKGTVMETWLRGDCIFRDDEYIGEAKGESLLRIP